MNHASMLFCCRRDAVMKRQNRGSPIKFLVPLIYAPVLPLSTCFFPPLYLFRWFILLPLCCLDVIIIQKRKKLYSSNRAAAQPGDEGAVVLRRVGRCLRSWGVPGVSFCSLTYVSPISDLGLYSYLSMISFFLMNSFCSSTHIGYSGLEP